MKINTQDAELSRKLGGKVSPELSQKMQPLIVEATKSSGLPRTDIQAALLKALEGTRARIGMATVERLLKDPKGLVENYQHNMAADNSKKQANFEHYLRLMLQSAAKAHPEETFKELTGKFPNSRNFQTMAAAAKLHVENGGRPLTVVDAPAKPNFSNALGNKLVAKERHLDGKLVLKDGEAIGFTGTGTVVGPFTGPDKAEQVRQMAAQVEPGNEVQVHAAPEPPQTSLPGID